MSWAFDGIITPFARAVVGILQQLWGLLSDAAFVTPDVTTLPQVVTISATSLAVVNVSFVLAVLAVGLVVMVRETVQSRYGVAELAPRLVIGWLGANFAMPLCGWLIRLANAVTAAFTGDGVTARGSLQRMRIVALDGLTNETSGLLVVIIGLVLAVLTGLLILGWIMRLGLLVVLVGVAPLALACHATPFTDPAARLWWRALAGSLATVVLQAVALHTALSVFLDPDANVPQLGLPDDPNGTLNLFLTVCLLWAVVKIPGLVRRYVLGGGGGRNVAGQLLRMVTIQQLTGVLRRPLRAVGAGRGRGSAAAGQAGGGGRRGGLTGFTRLPQPFRTDGRSAGIGAARRSPASSGAAPAGGGGSPLPRGGGLRAGTPRAQAARRPSPARAPVMWPSGRPVRPYTPAELAAGVDLYTRTVRRQPPPVSPRPAARPTGTGWPAPAPVSRTARPPKPTR